MVLCEDTANSFYVRRFWDESEKMSTSKRKEELTKGHTSHVTRPKQDGKYMSWIDHDRILELSSSEVA